MIVRLRGVLARLVRSLRPPGDAALRGLELDLSRVGDLEQAWRRLCETAWTLGFVELRMAPEPEAADLLVRPAWARNRRLQSSGDPDGGNPSSKRQGRLPSRGHERGGV